MFSYPEIPSKQQHWVFLGDRVLPFECTTPPAVHGAPASIRAARWRGWGLKQQPRGHHCAGDGIDYYGRGDGEHDPHCTDGCTRTVVDDDDNDVSARRVWGHHCSAGGSVLLRADAGTVCGALPPLPNHPQAANHNPAVRRCGWRTGRRAVAAFPRHRRTWRSKAMAKRWWCVRHTIAPSLRRPMLTAAP